MPADIEVARAQTPKHVDLLAKEIGILPGELEPCGKYKAKVSLSILKRIAHRPQGNYVLVAGEGHRSSGPMEVDKKNLFASGNCHNHQHHL